LILIVSGTSSLFAQEEEAASNKTKHDPTLELIFQKNSDGSRSLICNLGVSIDRRVYPIKDVVLHCYTGNALELNLGNAVTNFKGKGICLIPARFPLIVNEEGKFSFKVEYEGNDTLESTSEELQVMDAIMEMKCDDTDSIKTITVKMYRNEKGEALPLRDETVSLYIPRMFSLLKIGEAKLDSTGIAVFDFPNDLPGDSLGYLTVLARLEEHSDFGNIEKSEKLQWGIAITKELLMETRALWTEVAPVWMIVTLTILLVGVWAHYLYVVIHMAIINKKGKHSQKTKKA
jgi:hypothetical protein